MAAVELHGNLNQNARVRNMNAFHSGRVETLVATDIAARGIHVEDVALVIHADPPADHKAYLHRSGRTARAGNQGTVVTLMTTAQAGEVRALARAAGASPITTTVASMNEPMLDTLAPGPRVIADRPIRQAGSAESRPAGNGDAHRPSRGIGRPGRSSGRRRGSSSASALSGSSSTSRASAAARVRQGGSNAASRGSGANGTRRNSANRFHSAANFSSGRR